MDGFTVPDICRVLRVEPNRKLTWSVGAKVRDEYRRRYHSDPPKALRPKTSGKGSHCFAVYPAEMVPVIEQLLQQHLAQPERQGNLL